MSGAILRLLMAFGACGLLAGCEPPPVDTVQRGFRGTGMVEVYSPRTLERQHDAQTAPEPLAAVPGGGVPASKVFKNVQVLQDVSVPEFTRLMVAITSWVAPQQGCAYCHAPGQDLAADALYTKVVLGACCR